LIGEQQESSIVPHQTKAGKAIFLLEEWTLSSQAMLSNAQNSNMTMTWILRAFGILVTILWFKTLFSIIPTLISILPFLWWIASAWVNLVAWVLWLSLWFLTIAIAWLRFRPIIGIWLIIIWALTIWWLRWYKKNGKSSNIPKT
jgi:hypothetical protein